MKLSTTLVILVFITGCTKDVSKNSAIVKDQSMSDVSVSETYLPLTPNTLWKYKLTSANGDDKSKLTVLKLHKQINGRDYTEIKNIRKRTTDTVYYNQTSHDYYLYTEEAGDNQTAVNLEILFLKDDAPVGTNWSQSAGTADGSNLNCYGEIKEKDISLTVGDTTFNNVIHSYVEIRKPVFLFNVVVSKQDFYVAKNVGIIKNISTQVLPQSSTTTTNIMGYKIK